MKTSRRRATVFPFALFVFAASIGMAGERCPVPELKAEAPIPLSSDETGDCVMIFGSVGERFAYQLTSADNAISEPCRAGRDAKGAACVLPEGVVFDARLGTLAGVPTKAGFHEYVVQVSDGESLKERVVLIDIVDKSLRGVDSYAAYFFGGIR